MQITGLLQVLWLLLLEITLIYVSINVDIANYVYSVHVQEPQCMFIYSM